MYEHLIGQVIDKSNADFADFPISLDGQVFDGYHDGFLTHDVNPPVINVTKIYKLQFVEYLESKGELSNLMNLLDSDSVLKFKWDAATMLEVDNPLVVASAAALGITDVQAVFNEIGQ
jgi:hypothetical protein